MCDNIFKLNDGICPINQNEDGIFHNYLITNCQFLLGSLLCGDEKELIYYKSFLSVYTVPCSTLNILHLILSNFLS